MQADRDFWKWMVVAATLLSTLVAWGAAAAVPNRRRFHWASA